MESATGQRLTRENAGTSSLPSVLHASPRSYYSIIRRDPDRVHPALRSPAVRRTSGNRERDLVVSTSCINDLAHRTPATYSSSAAMTHGSYPDGHVDQPRPTPSSPGRLLRSKARSRLHDEYAGTTRSEIVQREEHQRPYYYDKPLPPLPVDGLVVLPLEPGLDVVRRCTGPGRLAVKIDHLGLRAHSIQADIEYEHCTGTIRRSVDESRSQKGPDRRSSRFACIRRLRRYARSDR